MVMMGGHWLKDVSNCLPQKIISVPAYGSWILHGIEVKQNTNCVQLPLGVANLLVELNLHHVPVWIILNNRCMVLSSSGMRQIRISNDKRRYWNAGLCKTSPRNLHSRTTGGSWDVDILIAMGGERSCNKLRVSHPEYADGVRGILWHALLLRTWWANRLDLLHPFEGYEQKELLWVDFEKMSIEDQGFKE